jgi:bifunctional NMN adenylyltransferase/nudix hydrolase
MKDSSSFYLNIFPWEFIPAPYTEPIGDFVLDATNVRNVLFDDNLTIDHKVNVLINRQVPVEVLVYFIEWSKTEAYQQIMRERAYIAKYKKSWEAAPHTPIFSTVDCLLTCGDYVLLIKRKREPGAGLWAMSGGFLEPSERIIDGVFRELSEESQIEVPEDFLRESIVGWHVEDEPTRDERGRIVSHICHVDLPYTCNMLPATRPADDAAESVWVHRKDLTMVDFYADHSYIVQKMLKFKFQ